MRAAAVEGLDALLLIHAEGSAQQTAVVIVVDIGKSHIAVQELAYVATEIHLAAVLQRGNGNLLQLLNGQVHIQPVVPVVHMAVIVYLIYLIIWATGIVHQHHIVPVQILTLIDAIGLEELLRGIGLTLPGKLGGRNAVSHHQHTVHGSQLLHLQGLQLLLAHTRLALLAQGDTELAEFPFQVSAELAGAVADVCLGHDVSRDYTVLGGQVRNARIGSAVRERMLEEPAYHLAVNGLLAGIDNPLQEQIALLQLVIEEQVALAQHQVLGVQLLHSPAAQYVQPCKEPAAAAALLVSNTRILYLDAEVFILGSGILLIHGHLADSHVADGITHRLLGGCSRVASLQGLQDLGGDARLSIGS